MRVKGDTSRWLRRGAKGGRKEEEQKWTMANEKGTKGETDKLGEGKGDTDTLGGGKGDTVRVGREIEIF